MSIYSKNYSNFGDTSNFKVGSVNWRRFMSCTIHYKGTLKVNHNLNDVLEIVSKHLKNINAILDQTENPIIINFLQGQSESLVFDFKNKSLDNFFRWNGENPEEFFRIFDMFIEIKQLFNSMKIDDDEGFWHEYVIQKQSCKIKLRQLYPKESEFLERMKINENIQLDKIEELVMTKSRFTPFYKNLLRVIVQDFIAIMKIECVDDFNPQDIMELIIESKFLPEYFKRGMGSFDFYFNRMLLAIWLSHTFEYKEKGKAVQV